MKKIIILFVLVGTTLISFGQTKAPVTKSANTTKPAISKFGALAIDRTNGFYYGWSYDYATLAEAENKAVEECNKKGGSCSVVLSFSGAGCAAYRTIDGSVGMAYGWGLAKTKEEADAIAIQECLKRSNGKPANNFVWGCNSESSADFKKIYDASSEILSSITIGSQTWTSVDLDVSKFRNGDQIFNATTAEQWDKFAAEKKPAFTIVNGRKQYNGYAVNDKRGLAPLGYHIPSDEEWNILIRFLGGMEVAGNKLKNNSGWFENGNGSNSSSFSALPGGVQGSVINGGKSPRDITREGEWWSSSVNSSGNNWTFELNCLEKSVYRSQNGSPWGLSVRCLKGN
jgi:uncharacterized protein (TIGR02145 family)